MLINLVLVDDHPLVLKGLEMLLSTQEDFMILACCTDGEQALQAIRQYTPDILVLDLRMPGMDGLTVLRKLRQENRLVKVTILAGELSNNETLEAIRLGVRGVVLKEMAPHLLIQCLYKVYAGGEWVEKRSFSRALDHMVQREAGIRQATDLLTPREIELVCQVTKGFDNRQIAQALYISEGTVKVHLHHIFEKLGIRNRVALAMYAQEKNLV